MAQVAGAGLCFPWLGSSPHSTRTHVWAEGGCHGRVILKSSQMPSAYLSPLRRGLSTLQALEGSCPLPQADRPLGLVQDLSLH